MTIGWLVMSFIPVLFGHSAGTGVTACFIAHGTASTYAARRIVTSTFQKAGVGIVWRDPPPAASDVQRGWLRIELVETTPDEQFPAVLAVSYPRARCSKGITVFLDRIRALANDTNRESALLGYVLVHEMAHVIQGVSRHSPTGVMKGRWTEADRAAIFEGRLGFEDVDVQLMRQGLAGDWCGAPTGLMDRSGSGTAVHRE